MNSLRHNLLTYIGYVLDGKFSYRKVSSDFTKLRINHEMTTLRKEFSLLKKDGLITFRLRYKKPHPVLTIKGKLEVKTRLAFKKYGPWDNKWRVVLFDLPQEERKYRLLLVEALLKMGFAPLHRGAYISPYNVISVIERLTNHLGIKQYLNFLLVEKIANDRNIYKLWQLDKINDNYSEFIKSTQRIQRHARLWPLQAKQLEEKFSIIFENDPHLPDTLLTKDWQGEIAYKIFKEISNSY